MRVTICASCTPSASWVSRTFSRAGARRSATWRSLRDRLPPGGVRWIVLDVDGTLRQRTGVIADAVRAAIHDAQAAGVLVSIATGRRYPAAKSIVDDLGLNGPVICYQGAAVRAPDNGALLYHRPIELDDARDVIHFARELALDTAVNVDDRSYTESTESHPYFDRIQPPAVRLPDLLAWLDQPPTTISIISRESATRTVTQRYREAFGSRLYVSTGHPLLTDVSHADVSKARAVRALAEERGIPLQAVVAIGDDWNDLELIEIAGIGVAMGNAHDDVLAVADVVAPPIEADGAAVAIRELAL